MGLRSSGTPRPLTFVDFWSICDAGLNITTVAADISLPSITVAGLGPGVISRVIALLKVRNIFDTAGLPATSNSLVGVSFITVRKVGSTFINAVQLDTNLMRVPVDPGGPALNIDPGYEFPGTIDLGPQGLSEVDSEATYEFEWKQARASGNNLVIRDILCGLRVYIR